MRFLAFLRTCATIVLAAACALFTAFLYASPVFGGGVGYEFSLGGSSSAEQIVSGRPAVDKFLLGRVEGESARFEGDRYEALKAQFGATLLFTERVGDVTNYYLYSPQLKGGVALGGYVVNLHIAVRGEVTAAGTPLIFGGF